MSIKDLLNLPPEERIKKAKELLFKLEQELIKETKKENTVKQKEVQKEIEKEIAQLKKVFHEAEAELSGRNARKEKIPIEEIAKEELEGLSQEGKEMIKALKNIHEKKQESKDDEKKQEKKYEVLEETVAKEQKNISPETARVQIAETPYGISPISPFSSESRFGAAYGMHSTKPLGELYQEASALRKSIEEKGYVSQADERRAEYFTAAVQDRMQAVQEGTYSLSEQAARAASLTQMIGENIQQNYRGKRKNEYYS